MRVSLCKFADLMDKYPKWAYTLRDKGVLRVGRDGKIDVKQAKAAVAAYHGARESGELPPPPMAVGDAAEQRKARLDELKIKALELKVKKDGGKTLDREQTERDVRGAGALIRDRLLEFPDRLATELAVALGVEDKTRVRQVVDREVRTVLRSLARRLRKYRTEK